MKRQVWKVFQFTGWFVVLLAITLGLLYASILVGEQIYGSALLLVVGIILVIVGEHFISIKYAKRYLLVWQAGSIAGAFSITIGVIWLVIQFLQAYQSWYSILILLALGIGLIVVGENFKLEK